MNRKLTAKQKQKYVKVDKGFICPYCDSNDISGNGFDSFTEDKAYQEVQCNNCMRTWTDEYTLTGIYEPSKFIG